MSDRVNNSPRQHELSLLSHKFQVMFALFCAKQVEDGWKDSKESVEAIEVVERWLDGKATAEECRNAVYAAYAAYAATTVTAYNAAHTAVYAAAYDAYAAAYSTASAAYAAASAVNTTTKKKLIKSQWEYYNELLHFDDIAQNILLGE